MFSLLSDVFISTELDWPKGISAQNGTKLLLGAGAVSRCVYRQKLNSDTRNSENVAQARARAAF